MLDQDDYDPVSEMKFSKNKKKIIRKSKFKVNIGQKLV